MASAEDFKINLNQNLWGLVVSLVTLGIAEFYHLCTLYWFGVVLTALMSISMAFTTYSYTRQYMSNKNDKTK